MQRSSCWVWDREAGASAGQWVPARERRDQDCAGAQGRGIKHALVPALPRGDAMTVEAPASWVHQRHGSHRNTGSTPGSHSCADEYRQCSGAAANPRFTGLFWM